MNASPWRMSNYYPGKWFRVASRESWGYGYCTGMRDGQVVLRYVDVPDVAEAEIVVPRTETIHDVIPKGTRVWVRGTPFGWHAGVVERAGTNDRYFVSLVGVPHALRLYQDQFKIRWARPLENPAEAIANGLCEAPTYYEARSALLSELVVQRRASRGLTAAISAPINLFQHQVDTAARVLGDPVMRFLLADEVGLGKTIEAGLVARQLLLDDPRSRVLVLCPESLRGQWVSELQDRLGLGPFLGTRLTVSPHGRVVLLAEGRGLLAYTLVIVDEAHNLLEYVDEGSVVERQLRELGGLLALSATPWRGDLRTFQRLLSLIDPVAYGNTSVDSFRVRVQEREKTAGEVQVLQSRRASMRQKQPILESLAQEFSDDPVVSDLVLQCRRSSSPQDDAWGVLSEYLREIYRLSRRMIRHRRTAELTQDYSVAGRTPTFVPLDDPARAVVDELLESYRRTIPSGDQTKFEEFAVRALGGPTSLKAYVDAHLAVHENALFRMASARLELVGVEHRIRAALEVIEERSAAARRVIVFSDCVEVLERLKEVIRESGAVRRVYFHFESMTAHSRDENVSAFLASHGGVLLADSSMEEGRNLQGAHVLVNMDLPLDANRLDQRIGRLDRYAVRTEPAEVVVFTEPGSEWVSAHVGFLIAIGVLEDSVSTVQRLLNSITEDLRRRLIEEGAEALLVDAAELRSTLETEQDNVDLLEELESTDTSFDFADDAFAELRDYEEDTSRLLRAFHRFTFGTGSLALQPRMSGDGIVEFGSARSIGLSDEESKALDHLLTPKTFDRKVAVMRKGVPPFRVGDPLVDWLEDYLVADERGRASAWARPSKGLTSPKLWLHCEFLVEFNVETAHWAGGLETRQLLRRGESHLQPMRFDTWTDEHGSAPPELVAQQLSLPFDDSRDVVIRGHAWESVHKEIPLWKRLCAESADSAWEEIRDAKVLSDALESAAQNARRDTERRQAVLRSRALRLSSGEERDEARMELQSEVMVGEALARGIEFPKIRLIACGACVLWPEEDLYVN